MQIINAIPSQDATTTITSIDLFKNVLSQNIVPEIIDNIPEKWLQVDFGESGQSVKMGNLIKPAQARYKPTISYDADPSQLYTLIMIDPDSPSRANHNLRNLVHYLVNNIPGDNVNSGEIAIDYVPPCPFPGTSKHRIVYLLYKQKDGYRVEFEETIGVSQLKGRGPLNLQSYANESNLGNPIGINFHLSDWDPYVQTIATQFGFTIKWFTG